MSVKYFLSPPVLRETNLNRSIGSLEAEGRFYINHFFDPTKKQYDFNIVLILIKYSLFYANSLKNASLKSQ